MVHSLEAAPLHSDPAVLTAGVESLFHVTLPEVVQEGAIAVQGLGLWGNLKVNAMNLAATMSGFGEGPSKDAKAKIEASHGLIRVAHEVAASPTHAAVVALAGYTAVRGGAAAHAAAGLHAAGLESLGHPTAAMPDKAVLTVDTQPAAIPHELGVIDAGVSGGHEALQVSYEQSNPIIVHLPEGYSAATSDHGLLTTLSIHEKHKPWIRIPQRYFRELETGPD